MRHLRALIRIRRAWFALALACTLAVRLLVPSGFMPVVEGGRVLLRPCPGMAAPAPMATMPGMHHGAPDEGQQPSPEQPCGFVGTGLALLDAVAPALLVAALLFAVLLAVRASALRLPPPPDRLRPPLRAPPLFA